jgi:uncharacterized protein (DUF924 family)
MRYVAAHTSRLHFCTTAAATAAVANITTHTQQELTPSQQLFLYMPLMHSERLADQERCVQLLSASAELNGQKRFAESHLAVVQQFGRFPHRNAILNRYTFCSSSTEH